MKLSIGSIASGSEGNCYVIKSNTSIILVDAGISGKRIISSLKDFGIDKLPDALLITHEHIDHVRAVKAMQKIGVKVFSNKETLASIECKKELCEEIGKEEFQIGDINVKAFSLSHDAVNPYGYSFTKDGACISIITDTGYVTDETRPYIKKSDILVLESNHDVNMLRIGRYPYFLKQRILSNEGHLSNETAANEILLALKEDELEGVKKRRLVLLAHLSKENNFPEMAKLTISNILEKEGFLIGRDIVAVTLSQNKGSDWYAI